MTMLSWSSRRRKSYIHEIWKRTGLEEDHRRYKLQSNYTVRLLRRLRSDYRQAQLRSTVKSQDVWKSGKDILGWSTSGAPTSLILDGELTTNHQKISMFPN